MRTFARSAFFCVLLSTLAFFAGAAEFPPSGQIDGPATQSLIQELKGTLLVLDVRTPEEFGQGHVPGALNIPVQELEKRAAEVPADRPVLIVCRTGRRAGTAYNILKPLRLGIAGADQRLWYSKSTPAYKSDGSFVFP